MLHLFFVVVQFSAMVCLNVTGKRRELFQVILANLLAACEKPTATSEPFGIVLSSPISAQLMILLFLFSVALRGVVGDKFDLSNLNWTLKNDNKSIIIPAQIPSQVHLDLFKAGVITDPLIDINGTNQPHTVIQWICVISR